MSKRTVPAASGAMPASNRPLLDIIDRIDRARNLVEVAYMAANELDDEEGGALQTVLQIVKTELSAASDALSNAGGANAQVA
jgi:hypothetical protein